MFWNASANLKCAQAFAQSGGVWGSRQAYDLLPSAVNANPHRTAAAQSRFLADSKDEWGMQLQKFQSALKKYDRTGCGILHASTVTQYARLHGVYGANTSDAGWNARLTACEPPGMRRRVMYVQLIAMLNSD